MNTETEIAIKKAYFRTPEGAKFAEHYETWAAENADVIETDDRLARLEKLTAKPVNKGIGGFVIQAVAAAGDEGIAHKALLNVINKIAAPKRFDAEGLRGFLSMQGLKTDEKPDAPLEEKDGIVFLTAKGKTKLAKQQKSSLVEDAQKALVVIGYKTKSAAAFIELVLDADADGKLDTTEKIVKAVTKTYKTI